jgi:hypothetical protein
MTFSNNYARLSGTRIFQDRDDIFHYFLKWHLYIYVTRKKYIPRSAHIQTTRTITISHLYRVVAIATFILKVVVRIRRGWQILEVRGDVHSFVSTPHFGPTFPLHSHFGPTFPLHPSFRSYIPSPPLISVLHSLSPHFDVGRNAGWRGSVGRNEGVEK